MARKRRKYTPEFKSEAVRLVIEDGLSISQAAKDLDINQSVLSRWVATARQTEHAGTPTSELEAENRRLRRENELLKKEREILKKAAAFFAKENL